MQSLTTSEIERRRTAIRRFVAVVSTFAPSPAQRYFEDLESFLLAATGLDVAFEVVRFRHEVGDPDLHPAVTWTFEVTARARRDSAGDRTVLGSPLLARDFRLVGAEQEGCNVANAAALLASKDSEFWRLIRSSAERAFLDGDVDVLLERPEL